MIVSHLLIGVFASCGASNPLQMWPGGVVPYTIDTAISYESGLLEPVFSDGQIENITLALQTITDGVPCVHFRFVFVFLFYFFYSEYMERYKNH